MFYSEESEKISEVKVLKSAAGYYIGHLYLDNDMKVWLPYDRLSGYYVTKEDAAEDLPSFIEEA
jgi:hypothetical protein